MGTRVTVFSKKGCVQCDATTRLLREKGVAHAVVKVDGSAEAREALLAMGHAAVPVVLVEDEGGTSSFSGFRPDRINALAEKAGSAA